MRRPRPIDISIGFSRFAFVARARELAGESRARSFCGDGPLGLSPWHQCVDVFGEVAVGQLGEQVA